LLIGIVNIHSRSEAKIDVIIDIPFGLCVISVKSTHLMLAVRIDTYHAQTKRYVNNNINFCLRTRMNINYPNQQLSANERDDKDKESLSLKLGDFGWYNSIFQAVVNKKRNSSHL
jgi:hypothetical protein